MSDLDEGAHEITMRRGCVVWVELVTMKGGTRELLVALSLVGTSLSAPSITACTSATAQREESLASAPIMVFENVTVDPVTVYIDHAGSRRVLGQVEPRRRARLRIPGYSSLQNVADLRLIVVPLGTTRERDGTPHLESAILSDFEPPQHLVSMMWSLSGRTLVSVALPHPGR